jgi:hypothetical protein
MGFRRVLNTNFLIIVFLYIQSFTDDIFLKIGLIQIILRDQKIYRQNRCVKIATANRYIV